MTAERRKQIINILGKSVKPVKGGDLASLLKTSRQAIVQDIAILRAQGEDIIATPQGYYSSKLPNNIGETRVFACQHDHEGMKNELEIMVYYGGKVQDVIVEHPYYGELKGNLMLETMEDINNFIENINQSGAEPLSILTKGVHLHTVLAPSKVVLDKIEQELRKAGILL